MEKDVQIFLQDKFTKVAFNIAIACFLSVGIWLFVDSFFCYAKNDALTEQIIGLVLLALCPVLFWARVYLGDIYINRDGIEWWLWGRCWKSIPWAKVKSMTVETIVVRNWLARFVTSYCLYTTDKRNWINSQLHGMRFSEDRPDADNLVAAVKGRLAEYNIPIIDRRTSGR